MMALDLVQRLLAEHQRRHAHTPYKPEAAAWQAPCPACATMAAWWSAMTTTGLQYRITCTPCGTSEWRVRHIADPEPDRSPTT